MADKKIFVGIESHPVNIVINMSQIRDNGRGFTSLVPDEELEVVTMPADKEIGVAYTDILVGSIGGYPVVRKTATGFTLGKDRQPVSEEELREMLAGYDYVLVSFPTVQALVDNGTVESSKILTTGSRVVSRDNPRCQLGITGLCVNN